MPPTQYPTFRNGDDDSVLRATKAQLSRLGIFVGDPESPLFDHAFEYGLRRFQQDRGLIADGILGPETFAQVELAHHRLGDRVLRFDPSRPQEGDDVAALQIHLSRLGMYTARIDHAFAEHTDAAVREAQSGLGLSPDGIVGPATLTALKNISRDGETGSVMALRERVRINSGPASLAGRVIVVESGTSGRDFKNVASYPDHVVQETQVSGAIAQRIVGRLSALGASAVPADVHADIKLGDRLNATAVVTITQDNSHTPRANGVSTFYYGADGSRVAQSPTGRRLAELVRKELSARTPLSDNRSHAARWASLSTLRTPKVHLVTGYLSNPEDREYLASPEGQDAIAESVVVAIQRLFILSDGQPDTGALSLADIAAASAPVPPQA